MNLERVHLVQQRVVLDPERVRDLRRRLASTRLPPDLGPGAQRGLPRPWLEELLVDWAAFDMHTLQDQLDALPHHRADVDGVSVHLLVTEGRGPDPFPLVLTHGWPGSFLEHLPVLGQLTDPAAHGGDAADAFSVVVPSLPGFAPSGPPPPGGLTSRQVAALWHRLMDDGLGHRRYAAHGSDLGAGVTAWLARDQPASVAGVHLATPGLAAPDVPRSAQEQAYAAAVADWTAEEGGYAHEHATKPATLGAALTDSPAGLAAWVAEKVLAWSSTRADGSPAYDRDLLLATLTLFWVTGTITTSLLPYWAARHAPAATLPVDDSAPTPTAVSIFGGEQVPFPKPPRALAERYYRLTGWAEHDRGGHFPAVAEPDLLAQTLRDVFRPARG